MTRNCLLELGWYSKSQQNPNWTVFDTLLPPITKAQGETKSKDDTWIGKVIKNEVDNEPLIIASAGQ